MFQWNESPDWENISACVSPGQRNNAPCTFTYGQLHLPLPLIDEEFFGDDGLNIRRFTEAMKKSCRREQIEILDANVMRRAVAEFARQRFPSASHAVKMQMINQVRDCYGQDHVLHDPELTSPLSYIQKKERTLFDHTQCGVQQ